MSKLNPKLILFGLSAVIIPAAVYFYMSNRKEKATLPSPIRSSAKMRVLIIYGTCTGTSRKFADKLSTDLSRLPSFMQLYDIIVVDANNYDEGIDCEKLALEDVVFFICSTWTNGEAVCNYKFYISDLSFILYDYNSLRLLKDCSKAWMKLQMTIALVRIILPE